MRRSGGAVVLVVIGLACSPIKTAHAPADAPAATPGAETASGTEATWIDVANAEVAQVGAGRRLTLALTRTPEAVGEREMSSPPRLVLDLAGPRPAEPRQVSAFPLADELVSRVRVGSFGGKLRAIVDLSRAPGAHVVRHEGAKVIIDLGDTSLAAAAPARAARKPARAPVAAAPPAAAPPIGIAIGIAAAAETPSSDSSVFTSCDSSRTLMPLMYSTTCCCVMSGMHCSPGNSELGIKN